MINLKKIIKEAIEDFDWVGNLSDYEVSGFYVTKPIIRGNTYYSSLYFIKMINPDQVESYVTNMQPVNVDNKKDYIGLAKHEVSHILKNADWESAISGMDYDFKKMMDGPYQWGVEDVLDYIEDGYFIKLS